MIEQINLRPYQLECLEAIESKLSQGITRQAVSAPTGAGKTIMFAELIRRRQHLGRALVLVHRDELAAQAIDKIKVIIPSAQVGKVKAESNEISAPIIVASVQTLSRDSRLEQLNPNFQLVIVDEAHHVAASTYRKILSYLGCFDEQSKPKPLLLGVSATLERADGLGLGDTFQEIVYEISLLDLIEQFYLVDIQARQITLQGVNLDIIQTRDRDFLDSDLAELMEKANAPEQIAKAFSQYANDRKAICFTSSVKSAYATVECLQELSFSAEAIDGNTDTSRRKAILERLKTGETQILVNCGILVEGYDETSINCVVLARPTQSKSLFIQMIGRGLRAHPGKTNCLILDCAANTTKHELISLPSLLGIDPQEKVESIASVGALLELRKRQGLELINGQLVSRAVDLFAFKRRKQSINWLTLNPQLHAVAIGNGNLLILQQERDHSWSLWGLINKATTLLHGQLDLETATNVAEDVARREAAQLIDTNATWRDKAASSKQLEALAKFRIPIKPHLTMGQASDLIGLHIAKGQLDYIRRRSA